MNKKNKAKKEIIRYIEGIGEARGKKLAKLGIKTLADLREIDIDEIAEKSGIPRSLLKKYVSMAEFQRINGINKQYAEALVLMKIGTFTKLASRSPEKIVEKMEEYDRKDIIDSTPALHEVMKWQEEGIKFCKVDVNKKYGSVFVHRRSSDRVVLLDKKLKDLPDGLTLSVGKIFKKKPLVRLFCFSHQYSPVSGIRMIDRIMVNAKDLPQKPRIGDRLTVKRGQLVKDLPELEKLCLLARKFPNRRILKEIIFNQNMAVEVKGKDEIKISKPKYILANPLKEKMLNRVLMMLKSC